MNIKLEKSFTGKLRIEIIDLQGKIVLDQNLEDTPMGVSYLNPGIYFLKIKDMNSAEKVFKLVKD